MEECKLAQLRLELAGFDADGVEKQNYYSLVLVPQVGRRWEAQLRIQPVREQLWIEKRVGTDADMNYPQSHDVEKNCYAPQELLPDANC